jgi:hypothetical protein
MRYSDLPGCAVARMMRVAVNSSTKCLAYLCALGSIVVTNAHAVDDKQADPLLKWETLARDNAYVTALSVSAPLGRLLLTRNNGSLCVIRFTEFHRDHDEKPATLLSSGEETLHATAEQVQIDSGHVIAPSREVKTVSLRRGPVVGLGRLGFEKGSIGLGCVHASLEWTYPTNVSLGSYTQLPAKRKTVEIAPSAWSEISQIDLNDPRLHWYSYDETRHDLIVRIDELPGSGGN